MPTILNPAVPVTVKYDSAKSRASKRFEDGYLARRFYVAKSKQGKRPAEKGERTTTKRVRPAKGRGLLRSSRYGRSKRSGAEDGD